MLRKIVSLVCVCAFLVSLIGVSQAATVKKTTTVTKTTTVVKQKTTTKVVAKPAPVVKPAGPKAGFLLTGGYGGGAGLVGLGFCRPFSERFLLVIDADYGFGNGYSVILGRVGGEIYFGNLFAGLAGAYSSYSEKVTEVPGLSGNFDKGGHTGAELYLGYAFGALKARLGYNTGLAGGLTASAMYIL